MENIINQLTGSDTHLKVKGSKLTRYDLLENKLEHMLEYLNLNKKLITLVYDNTGETSEFVERVTGTLNDTKELMAYYNENFIIEIKMRSHKNEILIYMLKPVNKIWLDEDLEKLNESGI